MTPTYEEARRCPRCGVPGRLRAEPHADYNDKRIAMVVCDEADCPKFRGVWFLTLDRENTVTYHTHTVYQEGSAT